MFMFPDRLEFLSAEKNAQEMVHSFHTNILLNRLATFRPSN